MMGSVHTQESGPRERARARAYVGTVILLLPIYALSLPRLWAEAGHPATTPSAPLRLDPNTASADDLMLLPDIGERLAERIVTYRLSVEGHAAFSSVGDLANVHGIGPATVEKLRPHLQVPPQAASPQATGP